MDDTSVAVVEVEEAGGCVPTVSVSRTGVAVSSTAVAAAADELAKLTFLLRVVVVACGDGVVWVVALVSTGTAGVEDEAKEATSAETGEVWLLLGGRRQEATEAEAAFFKMDLCGAADGDLVTVADTLVSIVSVGY